MIEYLLGLDASHILKFFSETAQNEIVKAGFFFMIAAWLHSSRVKKEIRENFISLTEAINNVAKTLRDDLNAQARILANHGQRLETLEVKLSEKPKPQGEANA